MGFVNFSETARRPWAIVCGAASSVEDIWDCLRWKWIDWNALLKDHLYKRD